jgi:hypothetical protein
VKKLSNSELAADASESSAWPIRSGLRTCGNRQIEISSMNGAATTFSNRADSFVVGWLRVQPTAAVLRHWERSANRTQSDEISTLARRAELGEAHAWAAGSAMGLTPNGIVRMLKSAIAIRELNSAGDAMPTRDLREHVALLRTMAAPPPWSEQRINSSVDALAARNRIDSPAAVSVMKSCLRDPGMTRDQRAKALGLSTAVVINNTNRIRTALGIGSSENLRVGVAKQVGMPLSDVVARIVVPGDEGLTRRVMSTLNASHREGVAEVLLNVRPGTDADVMIYIALDAIFHGGDPFAASDALGKQLNLPIARFTSCDAFLRRAFPGDRVAMLRTLGFKYEQIMSMNPVGAEISKRLDPALGTYPTSEFATRREKKLPRTREEASERLLRAGAARPRGGLQTMTYRSWLTVGLVSDKPSMMPSDMASAYTSIVPNSAAHSGDSDLTHVFRVAQTVLGREIPRSVRTDLMDRDYRQQANLLMLQVFGLGATRVGSGQLESIPTTFQVSDWPAPTETPSIISPKAPRTDNGAEDVTWQMLLPLLKQPPVK